MSDGAPSTASAAFARIKAAQALTGLKMPEKAVLVALAIFANAKAEAWPAMATLAEATGMTDRTAQAAIAKLLAAGHISRVDRPRKTRTYAVHPGASPEAASGERASGERASGEAGSGEAASPEKHRNLPPKLTTISPEAASPDSPETHHERPIRGSARAAPPEPELFAAEAEVAAPRGARAAGRNRDAPAAEPPAAGAAPDKPVGSRPVGSRVAFPEDFEPRLSEDLQKTVAGWPPGRLEIEIEAWRDWRRAHRRACSDFQASLRNWLRKSDQRGFSHAPDPRNHPLADDPVLKARARVGAMLGIE
jgi:hypothetical protein